MYPDEEFEWLGSVSVDDLGLGESCSVDTAPSEPRHGGRARFGDGEGCGKAARDTCT